jgi:1,4-alpha-glucan branching enzyme
MSEGGSREKVRKRRVTFSLEAADVQKVILGGDFNNWNAKAHPMTKDKSGLWKKTLVLPPGRYEYKFLADGEWRNDPKNEQTCPNIFGTQNNVVIIS